MKHLEKAGRLLQRRALDLLRMTRGSASKRGKRAPQIRGGFVKPGALM